MYPLHLIPLHKQSCTAVHPYLKLDLYQKPPLGLHQLLPDPLQPHLDLHHPYPRTIATAGQQLGVQAQRILISVSLSLAAEKLVCKCARKRVVYFFTQKHLKLIAYFRGNV